MGVGATLDDRSWGNGSGVDGRSTLRHRGDRGPGRSGARSRRSTVKTMRRWARRRRRRRRICLSWTPPPRAPVGPGPRPRRSAPCCSRAHGAVIGPPERPRICC